MPSRSAGPPGHATWCHGKGSVRESRQQSLLLVMGLPQLPPNGAQGSMWHSPASTTTRAPSRHGPPRVTGMAADLRRRMKEKVRKKKREEEGEKMEQEEEKERWPS